MVLSFPLSPPNSRPPDAPLSPQEGSYEYVHPQSGLRFELGPLEVWGGGGGE